MDTGHWGLLAIWWESASMGITLVMVVGVVVPVVSPVVMFLIPPVAASSPIAENNKQNGQYGLLDLHDEHPPSH
jgi:hypothetical protein